MESLLGLGYYFFWFVVVLSVLVFVHEFGHYWVAKKSGVKIEAFSIGFGKEIFGWSDKSGTRWKISIIPMGGYVKMFGDADPASKPDEEGLKEMTEEEREVSFFFMPLHKRIAIVAAGPIFNFIFALLALWLLFFFVGEDVTAPQIGTVVEDTPAATAGFEAGDTILKINGHDIESWNEMRQRIQMNMNSNEMAFLVDRDGAEITINVAPDIITERIMRRNASYGQLGVTPMTEPYLQEDGTPFLNDEGEEILNEEGEPFMAPVYAHIDYNIFTSFIAASKQGYSYGAMTLKAVSQLVTGDRNIEELGGPLQIAEVSGHMAENGMISLIMFMALLSVNLGLINLFPIPVLDGGHLIFYAIEGIRGKPVSMRAQEISFTVGLVLILGLMLVVFSNDILHLPSPNCIGTASDVDCQTLGEYGKSFFD